MVHLENKVFVITGCSSGLGKELAIQFLKKGAKVAGIARRKELLDKLDADTGNSGNLYMHTGDLTNSNDCHSFLEEAKKKFLKIDGIVLNAAISMKGYSLELDTEFYRKTMETNLIASIKLLSLVFHEIKSNQGSIVFINSLLGVTPYPFRAGYVASKHALTGWAESFRLEHYRDNIHILMVYCGYMKTEISAKSLTNDPSLFTGASSGSKKGSLPAKVSEKIIRAIEKRKKYVFPVKFIEMVLMKLYKHFPEFVGKVYLSKRKIN